MKQKRYILTGGIVVVIIATIDTLFMSGHNLQWLANIPFLGFILVVISLPLQVVVSVSAGFTGANGLVFVWSVIIVLSFVIGAVLGWVYEKIKYSNSTLSQRNQNNSTGK